MLFIRFLYDLLIIGSQCIYWLIYEEGSGLNVNKTISVFQALTIIILAVGFSNHVTIIPLLLHVGMRDSWVSVLLTYLLSNLWLLLPYYIAKTTGQQSLFDWLRQQYGKWAARFLIWPAAIYVLFIAALTIRETTKWVSITYLPRTPGTVVAGSLILLCLFIAGSGIRPIAITTGILLPLVWLLGYFVMSANFQYKDYSKIFPIFTDGLEPVLNAMVYAGGGFIEIIILLLFKHNIEKPIRLLYWFILAFILAGLTMGPLIGSMATYGPVESANQRYPAFEQWRLVTIGKYIAHVDFLALFQWLSGAFIRISLAIYILLDFCKPDSRLLKRFILFILLFILLGIAVAPISDMNFINWIKTRYYPYSFFAVLAYSILLSLLVFAKSHLKRRKPS